MRDDDPPSDERSDFTTDDDESDSDGKEKPKPFVLDFRAKSPRTKESGEKSPRGTKEFEKARKDETARSLRGSAKEQLARSPSKSIADQLKKKKKLRRTSSADTQMRSEKTSRSAKKIVHKISTNIFGKLAAG